MSSPSGAATAKVIVIDPGGARRPAVPLTAIGLTIGRVEGNDIVLPHESVSRRHARIDWDGRTATVTDLGSSNGTRVGETRLLAHAGQAWKPGDWLNIGAFFLQLEPPEGIVQQSAPAGAMQPSPAGPGPTVTTNPAVGAVAPAVLAGSLAPAPPPPGAAAPPAAGAMFESGRIKVLLEANTLSITPGQPAIARVTLANMGTLVDHFTVTVEGIPTDWVKTPEVPSQLNPGAQTTVILQINVARIAQNRSGDYPVTVRARSRENPNETGAAVALWTVQPFTAGGMSIEPARAHGRSSARYTLALENGSNAVARYDLSAKDEEGALSFAFEPPSVVMEPASNANVKLKVGAPRKWIGTSQTRRFVVQPTSPDGGQPPPPANGELVHKAFIPKWLPPVALAVAVAAAGIAYALLRQEPKAPAIDQFTVEPQQVVVGGQVEVKWSVRNATEVRLDPEVCPNPQPIEGECFFDATEPGDVEVNLVAINEETNAERSRKVSVRAPDATDPVVTVAANPEHIVAGAEVTITWEASNYDHITLRFGGQAAEFGPDDDPGQWTDKPLQTTIYTIEATNQGKVAKRSVKVEVDPAPTATATTTATATATTEPTATGTATEMPTASATATSSPTATMEAAPTPTPITAGGGPLAPTGNPVVGLVGGSGVNNVLYALTNNRILRSEDGGNSWVDVGPRQDGEMIVASDNPDVLYAGERNACDGTNFVNTPLVRSRDGGKSWPDAFPNALGTRPLLANGDDNGIVIADDCSLLMSFDGPDELFYNEPFGSGFRPTDAVASTPGLDEFVAVALNGDTSLIAVFDMSDDSGGTFFTSPNFFFGAELDWGDGRLAAATDYGVIFSDDNGETWSEYLRNGLDGVVFDVDPGFGLPFFRDDDIGPRDIIVDPTNRNRMWLATNRGVYLTENGGQGWNLIIDQDDVQSIAVSIENDRLFVASPKQTRVFTLNGG